MFDFYSIQYCYLFFILPHLSLVYPHLLVRSQCILHTRHFDQTRNPLESRASIPIGTWNGIDQTQLIWTELKKKLSPYPRTMELTPFTPYSTHVNATGTNQCKTITSVAWLKTNHAGFDLRDLQIWCSHSDLPQYITCNFSSIGDRSISPLLRTPFYMRIM